MFYTVSRYTSGVLLYVTVFAALLRILPVTSLPQRCSDVKTLYGGDAQDGHYAISIGKNLAVEIYCHGLQSTTGGPQEYITLKAGRTSNFATVYDKVGSPTACADKDPPELYSRRGRTEFNKVAVDIETFVIDTGDFTFANSSKQGHKIRFATAGGKWSSSSDCTPKGMFQVDFTGTPFMPVKGTNWPITGLFANGSVIDGMSVVVKNDYVGCFPDSGERLLSMYQYEDPLKMNISACKTYCSFFFVPYAGLKDGTQCFCGTFEARLWLQSADDSKCSIPCPGDSKHKCGAGTYMSIYAAVQQQKYTGLCGGYAGQCSPVAPDNPTLSQLKVDLMNDRHVCIRRNPCKNGATCLAQHGSGFKCLCVAGYAGGLCDTILTIKIPYNEHMKGCPAGYQAEQCLCTTSRCANAYFKGDTCIAADGKPKLVCRPSDPGHVILFNVDGNYRLRCPEDSELVSCTYSGVQNVITSNRHGQALNITGSCMAKRCILCPLQARCKRVMCGCQNGGTCNQVTGSCDCPPAYYGTKCETFDYCSFYEDTHNFTSPCRSAGICTPVRSETIPATGGDNAGDTCQFPFDFGPHTYHSCVQDNKVGPPFACSGDFHMRKSYIDLGQWSPGRKYTIAAWVRPGRIDTIRRTVVGGVSHCNDFGFNLNSGTFRGFLKRSQKCTRDLDAGKPLITVGKWYLVAITNNGTHAVIYQDGELREVNTVLMNHLPTTAGFRIGGEVCCPSDFFHGFIKTVKVWNRDLSNAEITRSMYNIGTSNSTTEALHDGLVGHWETGEVLLPPCGGPGVVNHNGHDWILGDEQLVYGIHCNIGNFVVPKGATAYVTPFNGTVGGTLDITAMTILLDGNINGVGAGYRGGATSSAPGDSGQQGESYTGIGSKSGQNNRGGGGGGAGGSTTSDAKGRTGAGGGYATQGSSGYVRNTGSGMGEQGRVYGDSDLSVLYLGSGGGSGGNARSLSDNPKGGSGGNGGGAIRLTAETSITVRGVLIMNGDGGQGDVPEENHCYSCAAACKNSLTGDCSGTSTAACWDKSGPGGGGSGGSIYLSAKLVDVGQRRLSAAGGAGGTGYDSCGAGGGLGRIRIDSVIFKGYVDDTDGVLKQNMLNQLFVDHSQTGQKQIDYTTTIYGNEVNRGCFREVSTGNRTLAIPVSTTVSIRNKMTGPYCQQLCRQKNFMYSGTQNGNECYCDNHLDMRMKVDDSDCGMACAGDPLQMCGGLGKIQVFGPPPATPGVGHSVVPKCQPWCATADLNEATPKWGLCDDRSAHKVSSWTVQCLCPPGKTGPLCDQDCPYWMYGNGCRRNCTCNSITTAICASSSGECSCNPGFSGPTCNDTCPDGSYGQGCTGVCNCTHNTQCDHVTGKCQCKPGWSGPNCNFPCPANKYGPGCNNTCDCNHGTCSPEHGMCDCYPGFMLPSCYQRCEGYVYGQDCETPCDCNQQQCDAVTGACHCGPGYMGPRCEMKCQYGYWGPNCAQKCDCDPGVGCDNVYGDCQCGPGLTGERCEAECPHGTYGSNCYGQCSCVMNQTSACVSFNGQCLCLPGYTGHNCEKTCSSGYYGHDCSSLCNCKNGGTCNPTNGKCTCSPGFHGDQCALACPPGKSGQDCQRSCIVRCSSTCNVVDGSCCTPGHTCPCKANLAGPQCNQPCGCINGQCTSPSSQCVCDPGWTGDSCDTPCGKGTYGSVCTSTCRCQHGTCDPTTGACTCEAGYNGTTCNTPCQTGTYGEGCFFKCPPCGPYAYPGCDSIHGACRCSTGYTGSFCDRRCPLETYGMNCALNCSCLNGGVCDSVTGACLCAIGYTGSRCESLCPAGSWGQNCTKSCKCGPYGDGCSPFEGACICKPGYTGVKCSESCPMGTYGQNCSSTCHCDPMNGRCSPIDGSCLCLAGYTGDYCDMECDYGYWGKDCSQTCQCNNRGSCNPISGICSCDPGFKGDHCEMQCDQDIYWGRNCAQLCSCNGAHCDHVTGLCQCPAGKIGHNCERKCDSDHFGFQCAQLCGCQNSGSCDHVTGACRCQPGWAGKFCTDACPVGYYGIDCGQECMECPYGGSCDPFTGACVCPPDRTGPTCNITLSSVAGSQTKVEKMTVSTSGIHFTVSQLVGLIVGFILIVIIVSVLAAVATKRYYMGRFGRTEGAVKFTGEEIDIPAITGSSSTATSGFTNPVHEAFSTPVTELKSNVSEATSGVASCMVDSDEEDPRFFKDSSS